MEKIALSQNTQKKLQSLVDNKDELIKKTQEELQKTYQARLNEIEKAFKSQLEAFTAALISQVVDEDSELLPGLEVSYSEAIALLKQMCEQGAIQADFRAGPLPKIDL